MFFFCAKQSSPIIVNSSETDVCDTLRCCCVVIRALKDSGLLQVLCEGLLDPQLKSDFKCYGIFCDVDLLE